MTSEAPAFDTHPDYRRECPRTELVAALGKRRARTVQDLYEGHVTRADLTLEQAIDRDTFPYLDGAWGPRKLTVEVAADLGLRLTDLVISNGAARGLLNEEEARAQYVTIGRGLAEWRHLCDADTLRMQHRTRVFVLSETPEAFGLTVLWEVGYSLGDLNLSTGPEAFDRRTTAADAAQMVTAPFTPAQVDALDAWQRGEHPVQCAQPECALISPSVLEASDAGLICPRCGKVRPWAWKAMTGEDEEGQHDGESGAPCR